jgi:hypothetical protein
MRRSRRGCGDLREVRLPYNTGSFWQQYGSVLKKLFVYALPDRAAEPRAAAPLPA